MTENHVSKLMRAIDVSIKEYALGHKSVQTTDSLTAQCFLFVLSCRHGGISEDEAVKNVRSAFSQLRGYGLDT